jgi:hypothetical protein
MIASEVGGRIGTGPLFLPHEGSVGGGGGPS